jgi:heptaprenyl diphosphate synthase
MELDTIYQPIQEDLQKVEERLVSVVDVDIPVLKKLLDYIIKTSGKRIRPALTLFGGKFYDYDLGSLIRVATAVELLHTATLVHDDVVDNSLQRRGKATVNRLWGDTSVLN